MRAVLVGKGGSGKSTLAGLLAVELAQGGQPVVALDADSVPGLAQVLGVEPSDDSFLCGEAVRENGGWHLREGLAETVERCSRPGPPGVRFLQAGNADAGMKEFNNQRDPRRFSGHVAFNTIVRTFDGPEVWVVVDLQGGTLQIASGLAGRTGTVMAVVEPFAKSVLTARRFAGMGEWPPGLRLVGVANKVTSAEDEAYVREELARFGVPLWGAVPADPAIAEAERQGRPLVSLDRSTAVVQAVARLADRLRDAAPVLTEQPAAATA